MKGKSKILPILAGIFIMLFISCTTVGHQLPISPDEGVIGTVQVIFTARDSWFSKKENIKTQAYIKLLEAAVLKFWGNIDIRDIVWVTGRVVSPGNTEVSATAKVIEVNTNE